MGHNDTVIGCIGDLDTPMTADQKGFVSMVRHLRKETHEDRQKYRDEVLKTSLDDFRLFADKLAASKENGGHGKSNCKLYTSVVN